MILPLKMVTSCDWGHCPTIYKVTGDEEHLVVQGDVVDNEAPEGEAMVRIPTWLLERFQEER